MTTATTESLPLGELQAFGPITITQNESGGWRVSWAVEWTFGELADAMGRIGTLIAIERATPTSRVIVQIGPERTPGRSRRKASR